MTKEYLITIKDKDGNWSEFDRVHGEHRAILSRDIAIKKSDVILARYAPIHKPREHSLAALIMNAIDDNENLTVRRENDAHRIFSEETTGDCFDCGKPFDRCECEANVRGDGK